MSKKYIPEYGVVGVIITWLTTNHVGESLYIKGFGFDQDSAREHLTHSERVLIMFVPTYKREPFDNTNKDHIKLWNNYHKDREQEL